MKNLPVAIKKETRAANDDAVVDIYCNTPGFDDWIEG